MPYRIGQRGPEMLRRIEALLAQDALARNVTQAQCDARRWPLDEFFRRAWHVLEPGVPLVWSWHLRCLCEHAEALLEGKLTKRNLMINIGPGTGKSRVIAVAMIAWWWLRRPDWKFICASGNPRVATRDSLLTRTLIESSWYRATFAPSWALRDDENTKLLFSTSAGGSRMAVSAGSKIVGARADTLLVDDPIDPADIHSKLIRESICVDWYDLAFCNRLNDLQRGSRIVVGTRLHVSDLPGHILAREAKDWEVLTLPMEFVGAQRTRTSLNWTDPRKTEGELLHAERFPESVLAQERLRLGGAYAGQYQQQPRDVSGEIFKADCLQLLAADAMLTTFSEIVLSLDSAFKLTESADFSVCAVLGKCEIGVVVLDIIRGRYAYPQLKQLVIELAAKWSPSVALIEDAASGQSLIQSLQQETALPIKAVKPDGAKEVRAHTVTPLWEAGRVHAPKDAPWLAVFLDEMCSFPKGSHDDVVDAVVQGARYLTQRRPGDGIIAWYESQIAASASQPTAAAKSAEFWRTAERSGGKVSAL